MTPEEVKKWLEDSANAPAFKEIAKALGFETPDDIQGLKANRDEFRKKSEKLSSDLKILQEKIDGIDFDEYHTFKEQLSGKQGKPNDELLKLQREHKKLSDELKIKSELGDKYKGAFHQTLRESALSKALEANKFTQNKQLLQRAFQGDVIIDEIDGKENPVIMRDGVPVSVDEFFGKYFPTTDMGKMYADKPINSGAGANNLNSRSGSKSMTRDQFDKLTPAEQQSYVVKEKGAVI